MPTIHQKSHLLYSTSLLDPIIYILYLREKRNDVEMIVKCYAIIINLFMVDVLILNSTLKLNSRNPVVAIMEIRK